MQGVRIRFNPIKFNISFFYIYIYIRKNHQIIRVISNAQKAQWEHRENEIPERKKETKFRETFIK